MKVTLVENSPHKGERLWLIYLDGKLIGRMPADFSRPPCAESVLKLMGIDCERKGVHLENLVPRENLADLMEDVYQRRRLLCERQLHDAQRAMINLDREFGRVTGG